MKIFTYIALFIATTFGVVQSVNACSPCGPITVVNQNFAGNTLTLDLLGSPGWSCQYTMMLEIVCANTPFNNVFTHSTTSINAANFGSPYQNIPFPTINVDLSTYCPGTYNIQAWMNTCGVQTAVQLASFTIPGSTGLGLIAAPVLDSICVGESIQLSAV